MKRTLFLFAFALLAGRGFSQNADSLLAVKDVDSLIQISRALTGQGDFDKALEVNTTAEKLALEKLGRESAGFGSVCFNHGRALYFKGAYAEAEELYLEAKTIREKIFGHENMDYIQTVNGLANLYYATGKYEKAEPLYLEAKDFMEKKFGKEDPKYATSLYNLATLYYFMGDFEKAERLHLEAKAIREKTLGKEHRDYTASLNNLAMVYVDMGNYEKAEPLYLEAKSIQEKTLGKKNTDYAGILINLGTLYGAMGNYEKAEPIYLEAKELLEVQLNNREHPFYQNCLNNLAIVYMDMGNYEKAEPICLEAIALREKALGKEHPDYALSLNTLAILYVNMGRYEKAEQLHLEAKDIWEKAVGKEHPDYAYSLNNLASMYTDMGKYEKAEQLHLEAKAIWEKAFGKEHPNYAESLNNLARLYKDMGNYEKAVLPCLEAKSIRERTLGKEHPQYAESLNVLADLYEKQNRKSASEPLLEELSTLEQTRLSKAATFLSERELANYTATFQKSGDNLGAYILARLPSGSAGNLPALAFDHALFYKGFLLTAAARMNILAAVSRESAEISLSLKGYRRRLAAEYTKPIAERIGTAELEEKATAAEKELARSITGYAEASRQVSWQDVRANLKKGEAAIEFIHFRVNFPKNSDNTMYAALVLRPDEPNPQFIPLFEEKSLDSLLQSTSERKADYVNGLYSPAQRGVEPLGKPAKSLYEMLWKPLENTLTGATTVYFSPSGQLYRLNLGAIPISPNEGREDETLADRYRLIELGSTRQLVVPSSANTVNTDTLTSSADALLFGGIQYEMDSTAIISDNAGLGDTDIASRRGIGFDYANLTLGSGNWPYLKWTEKEVTTLETILTAGGLKPYIRKGFAATEEAFKSIGRPFRDGQKASPRVIHLATHGFFFPDPKDTVNRQPTATGVEPVFKMSDNPMIRSGLLLAGSNYAWQAGKPFKPEMDDGILTAYEISQMNLSNTELVVLSACETGLGDIKGNEGVYGLQRAFKIAGAKYLIMSLWQVPDQETKEFMVAFYKNWLERKMNIPDAFRATQKEMRERFINPYSWAGFILVE